MELIFSVRNAILRFAYKYILKLIFFLMDPEIVHDRMIKVGIFLGKYRFTRAAVSGLFNYTNTTLDQTIAGIKFSNPVGLAAGFDKNAELINILPSVGFGFAEVGSITGEPCEGNPKPRLWRLKKSRSLVVYYGLKNRGCDIIADELKNKQLKIPIGTSVAKTNNQQTVDTDNGINDYAKAFEKFVSIGSYFTINISCPNVFGGEPFTEANKLDRLLSKIDLIETTKPIFLKLSPDISEDEIDKIIAVSQRHRVHGFICSNLTKNRQNSAIIDEIVPDQGGISGKADEDVSNKQLGYVYKRTNGKFVLIGCGGIFSAEDAYKKIKMGASLVQMITGMIFEGPQVKSEINQGLVRLLKNDGYKNISEAVGVDVK